MSSIQVVRLVGTLVCALIIFVSVDDGGCAYDICRVLIPIH